MPISQSNLHESLFNDLSMVNFPPSSPSFSSSSYPAISRSLPMFPSSLPVESSPPTPPPSPEDWSAPPTYLDEFAPFGEPQSFPQKSLLSGTQRVTRATDNYVREKRQQRSKPVDFWKSWAYSTLGAEGVLPRE